METFPIVKHKGKQKYGEFRPKRVILEIYNKMRRAMEAGAGAAWQGARWNMTGASPVTTIYETGIRPHWAAFTMNLRNKINCPVTVGAHLPFS